MSELKENNFVGEKFYERRGLKNIAEILIGENNRYSAEQRDRLIYFGDTDVKNRVLDGYRDKMGAPLDVADPHTQTGWMGASVPTPLNAHETHDQLDYIVKTDEVFPYLMQTTGLTPYDIEARNYTYVGEKIKDGMGYPGLFKAIQTPAGEVMGLVAIPELTYSHVCDSVMNAIAKAMRQTGIEKLPLVLHDFSGSTKFLMPQKTAQAFLDILQKGEVTQCFHLDAKSLGQGFSLLEKESQEPKLLPRDHTSRNSKDFKELGRGNTTDISPNKA